MNILQAIILAIIEGITEFLPVSSTGHMIIASSFFGIAGDDFTKLFTIVIQLGTILSVVVLYFKRFFQSMDFYFKLFVAFIPAVVFGLLLNDFIDSLLESPIVVAISLIIGGALLLKVDEWFGNSENSEISYLTALKIGLFQCLAMIPGVSRSGATIIGGRLSGLNSKSAIEYSFLLGIPTILGASAKKILDYKDHVNEYFPDAKCSWSYSVNVIDPKQNKVVALNLKKKLFEQIVSAAEDLGDPTDYDTGWDVVFKRAKTGPLPFNVEYTLQVLRCKPRKLTDEERAMAEAAKPIDEKFVRPNEAEVKALLEKITSNTDEEESTDSAASEAVKELG